MSTAYRKHVNQRCANIQISQYMQHGHMIHVLEAQMELRVNAAAKSRWSRVAEANVHVRLHLYTDRVYWTIQHARDNSNCQPVFQSEKTTPLRPYLAILHQRQHMGQKSSGDQQ
jgi:hypothetical protein